MTLSDDELDRYARQIVLPEFGGVGQRKLNQARVAMIGAGGIGSAVIPSLAGAGVGALTIIDDDVVDASNLQRQTMFSADEAGARKVDAAAAFIRRLNPYVDVQAIDQRVDSHNASALLAGHDLVVDGSDNFATRLAVNDACVALRIPLVSAAAARFQVQVALLRGWEPAQPCYRCWIGDAFDSDDCDTCAEQGILGPVAGIAGQLAALLAIRSLVEKSDGIAGKLFLFDAQSLTFRRLNVPIIADCKTCGGDDAAGT